jgi:hypothetical protein
LNIRQLLYLICLICKVVLGLTVERILTTPAALYSLESESMQIKFPMINSIVHIRPNIVTDVVRHFNGRFIVDVLSSCSFGLAGAIVQYGDLRNPVLRLVSEVTQRSKSVWPKLHSKSQWRLVRFTRWYENYIPPVLGKSAAAFNIHPRAGTSISV